MVDFQIAPIDHHSSVIDHLADGAACVDLRGMTLAQAVELAPASP